MGCTTPPGQLEGGYISPQKWHFEDDFPFPRWDMLIPWRVTPFLGWYSPIFVGGKNLGCAWRFRLRRSVADSQSFVRGLGSPKGRGRGPDVFLEIPGVIVWNPGRFARKFDINGIGFTKDLVFGITFGLRFTTETSWWFRSHAHWRERELKDAGRHTNT